MDLQCKANPFNCSQPGKKLPVLVDAYEKYLDNNIMTIKMSKTSLTQSPTKTAMVESTIIPIAEVVGP